MRFEELEKRYQEDLIDGLLNYIEGKAKAEGLDDFIGPTYEEYKVFFNEFDKGYKMVDDYPESIVNYENKRHLISFDEKGKVILEAVEPYEDEC